MRASDGLPKNLPILILISNAHFGSKLVTPSGDEQPVSGFCCCEDGASADLRQLAAQRCSWDSPESVCEGRESNP